MRDLIILAIHLLVTLAKMARPGGVRAVAAESLLLKHPLLISSRSRRRAPNLTSLDRFLLGLTTLFIGQLVDLLERATVATPAQLRDGLQRRGAHPRCRLPKEELTARLERYARLIAGA